ncbi:Hpt domain-containing protein [Puia sp.]|jgi:HPt (histidine-containing phosphotransfer) domain-containing protein|uniref:Hpt domain-containing protein n=1 Tax=Puia sp. TaxID=2045100 RepID=UPI002F4187DA
MEKPLSNTDYIFSEAIDGPFIIDLYAADYVMIEETFTDVLREYDDFVQRIITTYHENDVAALKSAVHKIKPLFGFVGLTTQQSRCLQMENTCLSMTPAQLAEAFPPFQTMLLEAKSIIEKENTRLAAFNAANR